MADTSIVGRALVVGPKVRVRDDGEIYEVTELLPQGGGTTNRNSQRNPSHAKGVVTSSWEVYVHDYDLMVVANRRILRTLNQIEAIRGWAGRVKDIFMAVGMMLGLVED
ncbi:hypothetical protein PG995_006386 [Apiospora arundinis]|uniref:Uncharacterized protein n=1 Tax=Apiospora kogelbergensis TaxID=1337665 RepID=A0AAW0QZ65_9PEZI